jgi:hypothetical protein
MIVQGKSKTEIPKVWASVVTRNPKIDVDKAIRTIIAAASQENIMRSETSGNKDFWISSSQSYNTMESIITDMQKQLYDSAKKYSPI